MFAILEKLCLGVKRAYHSPVQKRIVAPRHRMLHIRLGSGLVLFAFFLLKTKCLQFCEFPYLKYNIPEREKQRADWRKC